MKVYDPQATPFKEVDPKDVIVDYLEPAANGNPVAYGYLRSECDPKTDPFHQLVYYQPTKYYRIAYWRTNFGWRPEGDLGGEVEESILKQIELLLQED